MKNGEILYKKLKLGEITKSQLTEQQKGDLYQYMVDSKKVTIDMIKPEVAQKYNLSVTPTPSRSPDTNAPIITPTYTPTHIPSRSPDTNAINYHPPKSTTPEMELVDILSNITMPTRGRTTQHERQQGSAYVVEQPNISRGSYALKREEPQITWGQNPIRAAAENVRAGWNQFGRVLPSTLDMVLGDKGIPFVDSFVADQRRQAEEEAERLAKINQGNVGKFAGSVAQGIGQAIPSVVTSLIAAPYVAGSMLAKGGTQLINYASQLANPTFLMTAQQAIKQLMSNPNTYMSVLRGVGSQYEQAINDGATKEQAIKSAITGGIPSGLIESLGGAENLTNALASKAPLGRAMIESGLGEMFEEILQYPVENIAQKYSYDKDMPWFSTTEQAVINPKEQAYAGASAFVSSALMSGAGSGLNTLFNKLDSKQQQIIVNVEEGLNEIYTELDKGTPATEQDLNKIIEVLQNLEQQYPDLKEYLQGHMNKIDSYKEKIVETFKQPQTNETNKAEQSIEQDTNVAQIGDNDVTENIQTLIKQGSYKYNGLPVRYNPELKGEARNKTTYIEVGDKFFNLDSNQQINVLNHEVAHNNDLFDGKKFIEVMNSGIFGKPVTRRDGSVTWEGIFGDIGSNAVEETYAEALKVLRDDPEWLKEKHPKVYEYFTGKRIVDDNKTIDNIIPIDELRQKEILQDSNNIVTETQQKETFIDDDLTFKLPNKLNVDNPFLENTYHPFNMTNERERQRERQHKWLNDKLQNMNTIKLSKPYEEERKQYAIVTPSIKGGKYQITVFDNDDTPVMDSQRNTIKEVVEELDSQGFTYIEEIDVQATEQPTTNETIPAEQIVEKDKYVVKKGDYVKIDGIGIGIATRDKNVAIGGKDYYRDSDSTDVSKVTAVEYWQDLQRQINELKTKAKEKRKEAADYNKETKGMATKRKGKISMGDGRGVGFAENSVSAHHRKLLNEAKEFTDKANQLSNLVDERKAQLENRVKNNIPFNKEELAEAEILGVKVEEDKSDIKTEDKEPWQMTKAEYMKYVTQNALGRQKTLNRGLADTFHKQLIKIALDEGEIVPQEVLKDYPDLAKQVERKEDVKPKSKGGKHKKPEYSGEVFYKGKLIGKMTVADSDAFTTLLEATNGDAQRVLNEYTYFSTELRTALEKVAEIQRQEKSSKLVSTTNHDSKGNVLSKEQQEILKDSKLRDKNGNILLVYHGTDRKFDKFEPNQAQGWGTGIYFTDNIENAKEYGENIIEAYLDIKKPFYDSDKKVDISNTKAYRKYADKIVKERAAEENMTIEEYIEENGYPDWELEWDRLYDADGDIDIISDALQELGYDAFIGENSNNIEGLEIVVFNPDQIIRKQSDKTDVVETDDIRIIDGNIYYKDKKATTAKAGYAWFTNNKSRFNGERKSIMLPEFLDTNKKQTYRYYLTQRPPAPGAIPRGSKNTVSFDTKQEVDGLEAWGYVEYDKPLTEQQISDYELTTISKTETVKNDTKVLGKTGIAKDNEGNAIEFVYEVVNANDLITSHDTNLNVNNNYPSELQPRERTRIASQLQINDIINNLQPEFLGENPKISDGSPIVGNDNIVESGNGRTIALAKMYQSKHKNAQKYKNWLITNAETFGIDTNNLPENPVLIRRRTTEVNRAEFVKKANESSIATMSATETARSDADKLTNEVLSLFVANENGIINTTDNKGFIGKFISEVIPKNEQNKYLTDKGELSQEGLARVRNAIFYKAYGDINLMNKLAESLDNNAKNIINTMLAIAPKIVDIKTNIAKGDLYNIDYSSDIAQAANEFMALKETGKDVELYLQQESLFDNEDTALIKDIIAIFNANNRSVKKMTTILNKLFDSIENLGNPNQINMFGEMETPDKVHVLEATLRRLESEDNAQVTLFQSERKESTGDTQSNKGQTRAYKGGESYTRVNNSDLIDMSRPLKKPTDIRKDITKKFGVPTSSKKFNRSKKYLGYYKTMPEVIRLRYDNQIGTVMHELGHHLDKKYGFNSLNKQLINDMINKMNPAFKDNYQKRELPGEAIAEFLRYYTTDPTTAKEFAGEFYNLFESTLDKTDLKNIQEIRSDVLRWINAERAEKRQSTIVPLSQKKKVSERISETIKFEKANSVLFDRYAPIQEFVKTVEKLTGRKLPASLNPYMLVERTYKNNARIEGIIKGQLTDTEYNPLDTDDSLQKIVDDVKRDVTPFEDYLKLKHAITLAEKNHMIYNPDIYNNVEDMRQDLEFIEQQYPQFIELSERLYDWYDKFFKAWVVDTNMLGEDSKKIYTKMRQEYPYYVPMFRVREDGSSKQASSSLTDQKTPVDRLSEKGSDRDTISPIDNIITQVSRIVNAYTKNNVLRAIVENYDTVEGLGGFIDRVPPDMEKQILSTQSIKDSLETEFEDVDNIDDIINSIPDLIENYKPLTKSKDKEIIGVITKSGKRQFYQVFDKMFLNSLTNMNPTQLDATVRMIASIRRTITALTTGLNPIFGIAFNAPKDFTQAYIFGSYKNPAEYVYQYAKALMSVVKRNDNYKRFKDIGGVYGSSMTSELRTKNDFIRRLTKYRKGQKIRARNALSYIGELILDFNDAIETAPRLAEFNKAYKIAKNRGDSDYDATLYALSRADDVTLNFSRRGEIMNTVVGQSIPYLNAGLQGIDKLRRGLFTGEERTQTLIKSITMLTIPTILLWLAHRDDEDYEKLTKGIKDNYWILWKNPDGSFVRIPKPKDLSTIFSADFERALNAYFKEEGAGAFEGFQSTIADSLLPPVDTIFRPLIDVAKNEKWSGGKIVPMAMEYLPKTEQYDETTSRIAVELAQLIGKVAPDNNFASPKNVDYVLDQYYGGLADILLPMTTPTTYVDADTLKDKYGYLAMPMAAIMKTGELIGRKFKADPSYSNDVVNDFYDLRDKTIKANNAYKNRKVMSDDVDLIAENQFKAYYKSISSMWKTIDYIDSLVNKTLPDGYKESCEKLINQSRFADSTKQKVLDDLKDNKLNRESVTMLQKTIRDEIVKLADKAVKEYKANHKENNEALR